MASNEHTDIICLHDSQRLDTCEQEANTNDNNMATHRLKDTNKKRVFALIGSALSQLPIWGTLDLPTYLYSKLAHSNRFRHELRRFTRILLRQVDIGGEP